MSVIACHAAGDDIPNKHHRDRDYDRFLSAPSETSAMIGRFSEMIIAREFVWSLTLAEPLVTDHCLWSGPGEMNAYIWADDRLTNIMAQQAALDKQLSELMHKRMILSHKESEVRLRLLTDYGIDEAGKPMRRWDKIRETQAYALTTNTTSQVREMRNQIGLGRELRNIVKAKRHPEFAAFSTNATVNAASECDNTKKDTP